MYMARPLMSTECGDFHPNFDPPFRIRFVVNELSSVSLPTIYYYLTLGFYCYNYYYLSLYHQVDFGR